MLPSQSGCWQASSHFPGNAQAWCRVCVKPVRLTTLEYCAEISSRSHARHGEPLEAGAQRTVAGARIGAATRLEQRFQRCLALGDPPQHKSAVGTGTFLAYYNLGALYQLFGEAVAARQCFERAAGLGYEPACLRDADDAGILSGLCFRGTGY